MTITVEDSAQGYVCYCDEYPEFFGQGESVLESIKDLITTMQAVKVAHEDVDIDEKLV